VCQASSQMLRAAEWSRFQSFRQLEQRRTVQRARACSLPHLSTKGGLFPSLTSSIKALSLRQHHENLLVPHSSMMRQSHWPCPSLAHSPRSLPRAMILATGPPTVALLERGASERSLRSRWQQEKRGQDGGRAHRVRRCRRCQPLLPLQSTRPCCRSC
jgi:hypothetical protein